MRSPGLHPSAVLALCAGLTVLPAGPLSAQTGSVDGTVALEPPPPPRRTADRYPGGFAAAEAVQRVPAVVYVVGSSSGARPRTSAEMVQRDTAFAPAAVVVGVGATVDFPNADPFFHNVFSYSSAQRFDLGRYPQGRSKSVEFPEPGIVSVFCEVHEKMRGVIIVTESPHHAIVAEDGSFRIEGLPAGEHRLAFWSADHRPVERTVTVTAGQTSRIDVELNR